MSSSASKTPVRLGDLAHPIVAGLISVILSLNALLGVALPLFLITLTGQYMPGLLVLRNDGFSTSANPIVTVTGLGSLTLFGIGGACWGLLIGLLAYAVLNGRLPRREPVAKAVADPAAWPVTSKGAAN